MGSSRLRKSAIGGNFARGLGLKGTSGTVGVDHSQEFGIGGKEPRTPNTETPRISEAVVRVRIRGDIVQVSEVALNKSNSFMLSDARSCKELLARDGLVISPADRERIEASVSGSASRLESFLSRKKIV